MYLKEESEGDASEAEPRVPALEVVLPHCILMQVLRHDTKEHHC